MGYPAMHHEYFSGRIFIHALHKCSLRDHDDPGMYPRCLDPEEKCIDQG